MICTTYKFTSISCHFPQLNYVTFVLLYIHFFVFSLGIWMLYRIVSLDPQVLKSPITTPGHKTSHPSEITSTLFTTTNLKTSHLDVCQWFQTQPSTSQGYPCIAQTERKSSQEKAEMGAFVSISTTSGVMKGTYTLLNPSSPLIWNFICFCIDHSGYRGNLHLL